MGAVITTTAPYDVVATGFEDASGMAVQGDGSIFVVDRRAGTLERIAPGGGRQVLISNLRAPSGVAVAPGRVLVLDDDRVLQLDPDGVVSAVSVIVPQTRAIAAGADGRVWVAVRSSSSGDESILRLEPSGALTRVASGFRGIRAMATDGAGLYVGLRSLAGESSNRTTLARLWIRPDGTLGAAQPLLRNLPAQPTGVAVDAAGDVLVTGLAEDVDDKSGVVLKWRIAGTVAVVASGLSRPTAAGFGPGRDLFIVEAGVAGRLLGFRPPPPVVISPPPFSNRTPVLLAGVAQANSLVQAMRLTDSAELAASVVADPATGAFAISAAIAENAETRVSVAATAAAGAGLIGPATVATIVHDDHLPSVDLLEPLGSTDVAAALPVRVRAADDGSGMATLRLMIDEVMQSEASASGGESLTANALIDMSAFDEGTHALTAAASDRAGNWALVSRQIVVDRTAPETIILTGPPPEGPAGSGSLAFSGSDLQSSDLEFAWRLDGGPWSPFSGSQMAQFIDLAAGPHLFEVAARDRAGNVDRTPAVYRFSVLSLQVHITEPSPGSTIGTETVWVRGTVAGAPEAALTVSLPAAIQAALSVDSLAVPHEAGMFAVEVPVAAGMVSLTVAAREGAARATHTVPITVTGPLSPGLRLDAYPPAGLAPHTVRFPANGFPVGSVYSLDLETDGTPDYTGSTLSEQAFVYLRPGVHLATLHVEVPDGRVLVARAAIQVYERTQLDARLQGRWTSFKTALRNGDAAEAASFLHGARRAAWGAYFSRMTTTQLAAMDSAFTNIVLVEVTPRRAEYEMRRDEGGVLYSFPITFELDADGGWKLWQF
jgi:hypothetical protein